MKICRILLRLTISSMKTLRECVKILRYSLRTLKMEFRSNLLVVIATLKRWANPFNRSSTRSRRKPLGPSSAKKTGRTSRSKLTVFWKPFRNYKTKIKSKTRGWRSLIRS